MTRADTLSPISSGTSPAPRLNDGFMEQLPPAATSSPRLGAFLSQVTA